MGSVEPARMPVGVRPGHRWPESPAPDVRLRPVLLLLPIFIGGTALLSVVEADSLRPLTKGGAMMGNRSRCKPSTDAVVFGGDLILLCLFE